VRGDHIIAVNSPHQNAGRGDANARRASQPVLRENVKDLRVKRMIGAAITEHGEGHKFGMNHPPKGKNLLHIL